MQHVRRRKRLERRVAAVPAHAETLGETRELSRRRRILQMRRKQPPPALKHFGRSGCPRAREKRGGDAALRRPARVEKLRLRAVDPALEDARREAAANARCFRGRLRVELKETSREIGDAERGEQP